MFFFLVLLPLGRPLGLFPGWGGGAASGSLVAIASSATLVGPAGVVPPLIAEWGRLLVVVTLGTI